MKDAKFKVGDKVDKVKGYSFPGIVAAVFETSNLSLRYVVEMDTYHLLHIFNEEQLKLKD